MNATNKQRLRRLGLAAAVLLAFLAGLSLRGGAPDPGHGGEGMVEAAAEDVVWTCSMHPQIQLPAPGQCPICGMDLIPLEPSDDAAESPRSISLSAAARRLAEVETTPVRRRPAEVRLRMVGMLEADETRVREISAWVSGRIDRLYVDYTGVTVDAGDPLFDIYSPELYSAQQELLQAKKASQQLEQSRLESTRLSGQRTVRAARERLRLWGLTDRQIAEIETHASPSEHVTIQAPAGGVVLHKNAVEGAYVQTGTPVYTIADLSVLWLELDVYESDLAWVEMGQAVTFETDAYPGETFTGEVAFVDPTLTEKTRSVKMRVNVENAGDRLKPGMFARAIVHAEVEGHDGRPPLVIPSSAPLLTGTRAVVYVEDPGAAGLYEGREIVLGPRAGDVFVVREGLEEGEFVVTNGSFKIDSAMQIRAKPSMMSPEGESATPHRHDPTAPQRPETDDDAPAAEITGVPDAFRTRLDAFVSGYLEVATALSRDDVATAARAAAALPETLEPLSGTELPATARDAWASARRNLEAAARGVATAEDIAAARHAFYDLSAHTIDVVQAFGTSGRTPLFVYHCPMAMDGAGADWLQATKGTENPYYGSQMFTCGSVTTTLVAEPDAGGDADHGGH